MAGGSLFQVGDAVEFWRVLVQLSILALCLILFESALHHVEHKLAQYDKYQQMLRKAYRELMILGLISLVLKVLKEIPGVNPYSSTMTAFQVADLTIFILALALIFQAITIFAQLRRHNRLGDDVELITAQDLVNSLSTSSPTTGIRDANSSICFYWPRNTTWISSRDTEVVEQRLLRHFFLERFELPQLFPFSKYIRRAQAHQISDLIEVEPSMWILLLVVAWAMCGVLGISHELSYNFDYELVRIYVVFAWLLFMLHIVTLSYFQYCVAQILAAAGYSTDRAILIAKLESVADRESRAWQNETADSALRAIDEAHRRQEELEHNEKEGNADATSHELESRVHFRLSAKIWHVTVIFLMVLNGFYVALFLQCALYHMDEIYRDLGWVAAVMVPLPIALNALVLQQQIFRDYMLCVSIRHLDADTLGDVLTHFTETIELRAEFATSALQHLKNGGHSIADLKEAIKAHDLKNTGYVDVNQLRTVLGAFGYSLSRFRFNSVVQLLFELQGAKVEYRQLIQLLTLVAASYDENEQNGGGGYPLVGESSVSFGDDRVHDGGRPIFTNAFASTRHIALLTQSSSVSDIGQCDFAYSKATTPPLRLQMPTIDNSQSDGGRSQQQMVQRSFPRQFTRSSSRMLHGMYNIRHLSRSAEDLSADTSAMV